MANMDSTFIYSRFSFKSRYYIRGVETVTLLLELLRMNYDRLTKRRKSSSLEGEAA
jgi:hypothetical protein